MSIRPPKQTFPRAWSGNADVRFAFGLALVTAVFGASKRLEPPAGLGALFVVLFGALVVCLAYLVVRARRTVRTTKQCLGESEERFSQALEEAPIGMAVTALDGRFVRVNRALCEVLGYQADELERLRFQDITHPEDVGSDVRNAGRLVVGEIARYQVEKRYLRKDGVGRSGQFERLPPARYQRPASPLHRAGRRHLGT